MVASVLLSGETPNEDGITILNNFIDYTLGYFLQFLGGVDFLGAATKDAFREMILTVIQLSDDEELSTEVKARLMRSFVKLYVSYNAEKNHSLLHFAKEFLSDNQAGGEIDSRTTHLFGLILRNLFETIYVELISEAEKADLPHVICVLDGLRDFGFSLIDFFLPTLTTACPCSARRIIIKLSERNNIISIPHFFVARTLI